MSTPTAFVFTDFDDTLARGDSILPYLLYCVRRGLAPRVQLLKAAFAFLRWKLQPATGRAAKETSLSFIAGHTVDEMDAIARDFFRDVQSSRFFREGVAEMQRMRDEGCRIVVVSASSDVYMRVLPEFMPVDDVICTRCEVADGKYTGKVGKNCKGEEKVARISAWLQQQNLSIDKNASAGYGDSPSDAPMLLLTGTPVLVNPKKKLRARISGGRIARWE
ncbi:MAG: HAD-IB family hydrolase [Clostridia bacterium]|nr:HAD-IB family hydrolase [Clostridia bacterium]